METSKYFPKHCKPRTDSKCNLSSLSSLSSLYQSSLCGHSIGLGGLGRLTGQFSWRTAEQFQGSWERKARSAFPTMYLHHFPLSVQDQDSQICFDCLKRCKGFPPKDFGNSNVAEIALNLAPYRAVQGHMLHESTAVFLLHLASRMSFLKRTTDFLVFVRHRYFVSRSVLIALFHLNYAGNATSCKSL